MDKNLKILAIIVLLALVVRLPNIDATLSGDEIDTVGPARNFVLTEKPYQYLLCDGSEYYNNTHPPLRIFFYSMWASIFGFSAIAMRAVPLLFGLGTIVLTYFLGKKIYSEKAGLAAASIMALSRYHIFASQIVTNDNTLFIFLFETAMYFFVLYKDNSNLKYGALVATFIVLSLYAKITFFLLVPALIVYSFFHAKKSLQKDVLLIGASFAFFLISLFYFSNLFGNSSIFSDPLNVLSATAGSNASFNLVNKIFYVATITWQMTPFLSLLFLIALVKNKRDSKYWFLVAWGLIPTLIFMTGSGDVQRYVTMTLPAIFILLGRLVEGIDFKDKYLIASGLGSLILAAALGINDLMGYYKPEFVAILYVVSAGFLIFNQRNSLLLGAAFGLSIYFAFSPGFIVASGAHAVDLVTTEANEIGIPYNDVFTTKDVNFYITPENESPRFCESRLDKTYLQQARYIALYHLPDEGPVIDIATVCEEPHFVEMDGRKIGVVCKTKQL